MEERDMYSLLAIPCYCEGLSKCWEKVLHLGKKNSYRKGETFELGKTRDTFGYIHSGLTCCYSRGDFSHGEEIRFFLGAGCLIKETFVSAGYGSFSSLHRCLSNVVLYEFDRSLISETAFFHHHMDLMQNYIFSLSMKSVSSMLFSSLLKKRSITQKLAVYLYGFWLVRGRHSSFQPPLAQNQLAALLGLSSITVNRTIGKWKREGILASYTKNRLESLDVDRLRMLREADID